MDELLELALDNLEFFRFFKAKNDQNFCQIFQSLIETVQKIVPVISIIEGFAVNYDFDEKTPGNGYRSFISVCQSAVRRVKKVCELIKQKRESVFFQRSSFKK